MATTKARPARAAAEQVLVIERDFDASPDQVFKAWTEPERMMHWWGPKCFTCPACEIELRVGGRYRSCMRSPDGQDFWSQGVYREIVEPERIVCTDTFADEHGNSVSPQHYGMSANWPAEAQVVVTFTDQDGKTAFRLEHSPILPGAERDMCRQGWSQSLDKLADYLAQS